MEAYVIACAVKDNYIELTCRASRTEQKTIKKLQVLNPNANIR